MSPFTSTNAITSRILYALLFLYAGLAGTYEVANSVSSTIGNFNLRDQVQAPFQLYGNWIESIETAAVPADIAKGDAVLAINQLPLTGQALWQRIRWSSRRISERLVGGGPTRPHHGAGSDLYPGGHPRDSAFLLGARRLGGPGPTVRSQCLVHPDSFDLSARPESWGLSLVDSGLAAPAAVLASLYSVPGPRRFISSWSGW